MKNLIKKIYNKIFNDKNETYASLFKRFASFILDSLIILIIFNITLITLQYFGYDIIIYQQEAVMQTDETVGEILALGETVNSVNLKKGYQIAFLISTLYYTLTVSSKKQGTIGNIVFKIMVIDIKDGKVSMIDAFIRYIAVFLNNTLYCLGYLLYFYRKDRAFLRDLLSNTRVINLVNNDTSTKKE